MGGRVPEREVVVKVAVGIVIVAGVLLVALMGGAPTPEAPMFAATGNGRIEATEEPPEPVQLKPRRRPTGSEKVEKPADGATRSAPPNPAPTDQPTAASEATDVSSAPRTPDGSRGGAPAKTKPRPDPKDSVRSDQSPAPKQPSPPAVARLTAPQVKSLPADATIDSVAAALGPALSAGWMRSNYEPKPVSRLFALEPPGHICRYYLLVEAAPSPLVRLCFDANGRLRERDMVAPIPG